MASANLLALIDDIATLLDDVAVMTKVAAKKTAGVLGDDLAVNAEKVIGVNPDRELPVVWAVFKGSMLNKCILVPAALLISAFIPWAIVPILMLGGGFLCYEGFEKILHMLHKNGDEEAHHQELVDAITNEEVDMVAFEKAKISGAIRTDLILSAEIIAITLGTIAEAALLTQVAVLSTIAIAITLGVYGLVAGIVKLDDAGLYLSKKPMPWNKLGMLLVNGAPILMKTLSIGGTIAMFLVGGGIIVHGIPALEHALAHLPHTTLMTIVHHLIPGLIGVVVGMILVAAHHLFDKLRGKHKN